MKADYANEHTINFCSSTFFPLQRFLSHCLTLWCKTQEQLWSWYVNFTCQTEGMLRTSVAEQFPWREKTTFMSGWKIWFTSSQAICCGIIHWPLAASSDCFTLCNCPLASTGIQLPQPHTELKRARNGGRGIQTTCDQQAGLTSTQAPAFRAGLQQNQHFLCGVSHPRLAREEERYGAKPFCLLTRKIRQFLAVIVIKR